jgi:hypothetical protein
VRGALLLWRGGRERGKNERRRRKSGVDAALEAVCAVFECERAMCRD